jgi:hypothetical protein
MGDVAKGIKSFKKGMAEEETADAKSDAPVKSIEDARRPANPPLVLGGTGEGASGNDVATVLRDALGLNLKIVIGYPDSNAIFLAVDRKEVDGRLVGLSSVQSSHPEWLQPGSGMQVLLQFGRATRHPAFRGAADRYALGDRLGRGYAVLGSSALVISLGSAFNDPDHRMV